MACFCNICGVVYICGARVCGVFFHFLCVAPCPHWMFSAVEPGPRIPAAGVLDFFKPGAPWKRPVLGRFARPVRPFFLGASLLKAPEKQGAFPKQSGFWGVGPPKMPLVSS